MIIGISGKKQSGKDLVGKIIQYLFYMKKEVKGRYYPPDVFIEELEYNVDLSIESGWEIRKFADKLKDIVCLLIGCNREQLEDEGFKNTLLGEEWWYYKILTVGKETKYILYPYLENIHNYQWHPSTLIKLTPRKLLQLLGTECGRQIIHPNIWVNALMVDYNAIGDNLLEGEVRKVREEDLIYPNWIVTDVRFPNEVEAIKRKGGIIIRVNRPSWTKDYQIFKVKEHESETALDNYKEFDYIIDNDSSIENLIDKVKGILIKEKFI